METKSVSDVSILLTEEKQREVDKLFRYLVEGHIDIQKNLVTLKCDGINGQIQSHLHYRELARSYACFRSSEFLRLCSQCNKGVYNLKKFPLEVRGEQQYVEVVQELKNIQDFIVKYMCFLSRSRNFENESTSNNHLEYIDEKKKSSKIFEEMYEELSRKYINKMNDSEPITGALLASQLAILKKINIFKNILNGEALSDVLLYFLAEKVDVPAVSTKSDATDESANVQLIKMMRDSVKELIGEMKSLQIHQKTHTEDINAIKEMLKKDKVAC